MNEDIKKITIQNVTSKKKLSPKKDVIKKLASEPDKINTFIKDKITDIKKNELSSWIVPSFFSKKIVEEQPNRIESIIKDIQTHRKTNQVLSKKKEKVKQDTEKSSIDNTQNKGSKQTNQKQNNKQQSIKQRSGRLKSRKEGRIYTTSELKDLYKTLCELYKNGETKRITSILRRLTKNQCNQILHHKKLIKRSWTNAPLPLLRFLVYQLISCPNMKFKHIV